MAHMDRKLIVSLISMFLSSTPSIFAETILLKSGKTIEGKIVERTNESIKIDIEGIPITYYFNDIESIDGKSIQTPQKDKVLQNKVMTSSKVNAALDRGDTIGREEVLSDERLVLLLNNGLNYTKTGRYQEAISEYQKALEIDPNSISAYLNMGASYRYLGDSQKAIDCFQKILTIDPKEVNALNNLAVVYVELKKYDEAIAYFKKALEIKPDSALLCEGLGLVYVNLNQYKEASEWFTKAIQNDPKDGGLYYDLGLTYLYLKDYDQAKKNLLMAKEFYKSQNKAEAINQIDTALSKIP